MRSTACIAAATAGRLPSARDGEDVRTRATCSWELRSGGTSVSSGEADVLASPSLDECVLPGSDRSHVPHGAVNGRTMSTTSHVAKNRDRAGRRRRMMVWGAKVPFPVVQTEYPSPGRSSIRKPLHLWVETDARPLSASRVQTTTLSEYQLKATYL